MKSVVAAYRFRIVLGLLLLATSAATAIGQVSDDFSSAALNDSLWTFVDPVGDSGFSQAGGRLILSVPAGTNHDLWTGGNNSARAVQAMADSDFEIESKFESVPSRQFQIEGLLVEQDAQNYIRYDFYSDGASVHLYATGFVGGLPTNYGNSSIPVSNTIYLRLGRNGDQWNTQYSLDGTSWFAAFQFSQVINVSASGVYAGNVGTPAPAFDAIVDYFFNTASPIVPEDGGVVDITPPVISGIVVTPDLTSGQVSFSTEEPALGRVAYGVTVGLEMGVVSEVGFAIGHTLDLPGLAPATTYFYQVEAEDPSTNLTQAAVAQFTTAAPPNELPTVSLNSPLAGSAYTLGDTILLDASASDSDGTVSMVEFLADGAVIDTVLTAPWQLAWVNAPLGNHDLGARATDNNGGVAVSALTRVVVNPPAGVAVAGSDDFSAGAFNDSLWTFIDPLGDSSIQQANGLLTISVPGGVEHDAWSAGNNSARIMQPVTDTDVRVEAKFESELLQPYQIQGILAAEDSTSYIRLDYFHDGVNLRVFGADIVNNIPTVRANLVIPTSGLLWLRLARTSDQWVAEYSADGVVWTQAFNYSHPMVLNSIGVFAGNAGSPAPAFVAAVDYFFDTNNPIDPEDGNVVDVQPPVITAVSAVAGVTDAAISFLTDELAIGRVRYGLTAALELGMVVDSGFLSSHTLVLPGLVAETSYYYQIEAEDSSTNLAQEPVGQLTTLAVPNILPLVTLDTPLAGTHFAIGDTIFLNATANDSDGFVTQVEFLSGNVVVATALSAPWKFDWVGAAPGNHSLRARATDNVGGVTVSAVAVVTVDQDPGVAIAMSDDFSGLSLADSVWTFVNPLGDCTAYQSYGKLRISVPGTVEHNLWTSGNGSARIVQSVADADLSLEVKFESEPTSRYQIQGLVLEESPGNYIRVDFFYDGSSLRLFAASLISDVPTIHGNVVVPAGNPLWLRVNRTGDVFTVDWSADGSLWVPAFGFNHAISLQSAGVYAGNSGSPAPAFEAVVDYFFDSLNPIVPEDADLTDIWPPRISNVVVVADPNTNSAVVTCTTDEPATSLLSYGLDVGYGIDVVGISGDGLSHQFTLNSLVTNGLYHFSILASDTLANAVATPDQQFLNVEIKPIISVWGGLDQRVGHLGVAQADFNLVGNVFLWETLASMAYSVNGGPEVPLNWGNGANDFGDGRRLAHNGDFNVDLPLTELQMGLNTVAVRAVDVNGREDLVTAMVTRESGSSPLPVFINWDNVVDPQDVGQTVDGSWSHDSVGLRTVSTGYDRIFLIGEETWQDYEIACPITIHEVSSTTSLQSGSPGIGFLMRFTGHVVGGHRNWPEAQPKWGYQPFGGMGWLRYLDGATNPPTVQFYHGDFDVADNFGSAKALGPEFDLAADPSTVPFGEPDMVTEFGLANMIQIGETFWMKMRCETLPDAGNGDGVTQYSYKFWLAGEVEPTAWAFQVIQQSAYALRKGSVCLLAHNVDVTFGDVGVVALSGVAAAPEELPRRFELGDNYPNPFNPFTNISFEVPQDGSVRLAVFDTRGRFVTTLVDDNRAAGRYDVLWSGTNAAGQSVASGQYFYRLDAAGVTAVKKMLLLK